MNNYLLSDPFHCNLQKIITPKLLKLGTLSLVRDNVHHQQYVAWHMSCVINFFFWWGGAEKVAELDGGGSVINGAILSSLGRS